MICKRALRTGDGSYDFAKHGDFKAQPVTDASKEFFNMDHENMLWGWRDKDLPDVAKEFVDIRNRLDWLTKGFYLLFINSILFIGFINIMWS